MLASAHGEESNDAVAKDEADFRKADATRARLIADIQGKARAFCNQALGVCSGAGAGVQEALGQGSGPSELWPMLSPHEG